MAVINIKIFDRDDGDVRMEIESDTTMNDPPEANTRAQKLVMHIMDFVKEEMEIIRAEIDGVEVYRKDEKQDDW